MMKKKTINTMKTNTTPILSATFSEIEKAQIRIQEARKYICPYMTNRAKNWWKIYALFWQIRELERYIGRLENRVFEVQNGL